MKINAILVILFISSVAYSQKATIPDTTYFRFKNRELFLVSGKEQKLDTPKANNVKHWAGIDVGLSSYSVALPSQVSSTGLMNGYAASPNYFWSLKQSRSFHFSLNFLEKDFRLVKESVKLVTGLGLDYTRYHFQNNVTIKNYSTDIAVDTLSYRKNKLSVTQITLPIMIGLNDRRERSKSFRLAAGFLFGYRIGSKISQLVESDGGKVKRKSQSPRDLPRFRYSAVLRVGYGRINIYGSYSFVPLFLNKNEVGANYVKLIPYNIGVSFLF